MCEPSSPLRKPANWVARPVPGVFTLASAALHIDLEKITANARAAVALCGRFGIEVLGVTKSVCGLPAVARAMLAGGVRGLGDGRLASLACLREAGITAPLTLIRSPAPSETRECVELADCSLNASLDVLRLLSEEAARAGKTHDVMLMADLGTGREGFAPAALPDACAVAAALPGLRVRGMGVYFADRVAPDDYAETQRELVALARAIEAEGGIRLPVVSGGSSGVFGPLTAAGRHVEGVNQLRIGMAILEGLWPSKGPERVPGFETDAFVLDAEVIESKSRPDGRAVAILAFGYLDAHPEYVFPLDAAIEVLRMTHDHTVVDVTRLPSPPRPGDRLRFRVGYRAIGRLVLSPSVRPVMEPRDASHDA